MKQLEALEVLKSGANVFLTGEPGAGKSYTINLFKKWAESKGIYPSITASTGIAATHINGVTIHSWSGIGIKEVIGERDLRAISEKEYVARRVMEAKILIIDEISMINGRTLDNVDAVCRYIRAIKSMENQYLPFGGIQVIFVGDFFQLPPVEKHGFSNKKVPVQFAFQSQAWLAAEPKICYLTEQHRQEDKVFLDLLTAMRAGKLVKKHITTLTNRRRPAPEDITRLFTHNADVDRVNEDELRKLPGEEKRFDMQSSGIPFMVEILQKSCLSPAALYLKAGAPVMFTRNDSQKDGEAGEYVNGTLGKVIDFRPDGFPIVETKDGRIISIEKRQEWSIVEHGQTKATIYQVPLRLAWAITVHKCQGMSLDAATMDLGKSFEYGQGYVALSRVRSLDGLYLEGINSKALEMHPTVVEKDGMFRKLSGL